MLFFHTHMSPMLDHWLEIFKFSDTSTRFNAKFENKLHISAMEWINKQTKPNKPIIWRVKWFNHCKMQWQTMQRRERGRERESRNRVSKELMTQSHFQVIWDEYEWRHNNHYLKWHGDLRINIGNNFSIFFFFLKMNGNFG